MADYEGFKKYMDLLNKSGLAAQKAASPAPVKLVNIKNPFEKYTYNTRAAEGVQTFDQTLAKTAARRLTNTAGVSSYKGLDPVADSYEAVRRYMSTMQESAAAGGRDPQKAGLDAFEKYMQETEARYRVNGKSAGEIAGLLKESGYRSPAEQKEYNDRRLTEKTAELAGRDGPMTEREAQDYLYNLGIDTDLLQKSQGGAEELAGLYENIGPVAEKARRFGAETLTDQERTALYALNPEGDPDYLNNLDALTERGRQTAEKIRSFGNPYEAYKPTTYQKAVLNAYRQTPEGAAAWLEESEGSGEYEAAQENKWFVDHAAHYADIRSRDDFDELAGKNEEGIRALMNQAPIQRYPMTGGLMDATRNNAFNEEMTQEEKDMYQAVKNLEGEDAAREYLDYITYDINKRLEAKTNQALYDLSNGGALGAVGGSALSLATNLGRVGGTLDFAGQYIRNMMGDYRPIDTHREGMQYGSATDALRQGVQDQVDWSMNVLGKDVDLFDFLYGTGMSGLDSMTAGAVGAGAGGFGTRAAEWTTAAVIGTQAGQSAIQEAKQNGASDSQALLMGTLAGTFETLFEKVSIGKFYDEAKHLGKRSLKDALINVGAQAGINFSEEFWTEVADALAEKAVLGDKSETERNYQHYVEDLGLTEDEARNRVAKDVALRLAEAGVGGAIMGAGFGAMANITSDYRTGKANRQTGALFTENSKKAAWDIAATLEGTDAARLVRKYSLDKANDRQAGEVFRAVVKELPKDLRGPLRQRVAGDLANGLLRMTEQQDFTEDDQMAVEAVSKLVTGEGLTEQEMRTLAGNERAMELMRQAMATKEEQQQTGQPLTEEEAAGRRDQMGDENSAMNRQEQEETRWELMPTLTEEEQAGRRDQGGTENIAMNQPTRQAGQTLTEEEAAGRQEQGGTENIAMNQPARQSGQALTDEEAAGRRDQGDTENIAMNQPARQSGRALTEEEAAGRRNQGGTENAAMNQPARQSGQALTEEEAAGRREQMGDEWKEPTIRESREELAAQREELRNRVTGAERDLEAAKAELNQTQERAEQAEAALRNTQQQLDKAKTDLTNAEKSMETLREQAANLTAKSSASKWAARKYAGQLQNALNTLEEMKGQKQRAEETIAALQGQLQEQQEAVKAAHAANLETSEKWQAAQDQLKAAREELQSAQAERDALRENLTESEAGRTAAETQREELRQKLTETEAQRDEAARELLRKEAGEQPEEKPRQDSFAALKKEEQQKARSYARTAAPELRATLNRLNTPLTDRELAAAVVAREGRASFVGQAEEQSQKTKPFAEEAKAIQAAAKEYTRLMGPELKALKVKLNTPIQVEDIAEALAEAIRQKQLERMIAIQRGDDGITVRMDVTPQELEELRAMRRERGGASPAVMNQAEQTGEALTDEEYRGRRDQYGDALAFVQNAVEEGRELTREEMEQLYALRREQESGSPAVMNQAEQTGRALTDEEYQERREQYGSAMRAVEEARREGRELTADEMEQLYALRREQESGGPAIMNREEERQTGRALTEEERAGRRDQGGSENAAMNQPARQTGQALTEEEYSGRRDQQGDAGALVQRAKEENRELTREEMEQLYNLRQDQYGDARAMIEEAHEEGRSLTAEEMDALLAARRDQGGDPWAAVETAREEGRSLIGEEMDALLAARRDLEAGSPAVMNRAEEQTGRPMTEEEYSGRRDQGGDAWAAVDAAREEGRSLTTEEMNAILAERRERETASPAIMNREEERQSGEALSEEEFESRLEQLGDSVELDDMILTEGEKKMLDQGEQFGGMNVARDMLLSYRDSKETPERYTFAYRRAYQEAERGQTLENVREQLGDELTEEQLEKAFAAGEQARKEELERRRKMNQRNAEALGFRTTKEDDYNPGVTFSDVQTVVPGGKFHAMLQIIDAAAKKAGVQVRVHQTLNGENANYETGTNIINIGLDAEDGALTKYASHELYHYIYEWAGEQAKEVQGQILSMLEKARGYDLAERIKEVRDKYLNQKGQKLSEDEAKEEIAANAALDFIGTEENLRELAKDRPTLAQRIAEWAGNMAKNIRSLLERVGRHNKEVRAMLPFADGLREVQTRLNDMLGKARENYQRAQIGSFESAKSNAAVQRYQREMQGRAISDEDFWYNARELGTSLYIEAAGEQADEEAGLDNWFSAMRDYQADENPVSLETALERRGLPIPDRKDFSAITYAAKQQKLAERATGVQMKARGELEAVREDGTRHSLRDDEYMEAVESGNINPSQVKSDETVTYDENGNVIPLYERFNTEQKDIRFDLRDDYETEQMNRQDQQDQAFDEALSNYHEIYFHKVTDGEMQTAIERLRQLHQLTAREGMIDQERMEKAAKTIAKKIKEETGTRMGVQKLTQEIQEAARLLANNRAADYDLADAIGSLDLTMTNVVTDIPGVLDANLTEDEKQVLDLLKHHKISLSDGQIKEISGREGLKYFYGRNLGRMHLRKEGGKDVSRLSSLWEESLYSINPSVFQYDTNPLDMPYILDAYLEKIKQKTQAAKDVKNNAYSKQGGQYISGMVIRTMMDLYDAPGVLPTFAEGYDEGAAMRSMGSALAQARKEAEDAVQTAADVSAYLTRLEERIDGDKKRQEERKARDSVINEIKKHTRKLSNLSMKGTDTRHVPEDLRGAIEMFAHNMWGNRAIFSGAEARALESKYSQLAQDGALHDTAAATRYDPEIREKLNWLAENAGTSRQLYQMTKEQLQNVLDVVGNLRKLVDEANQIFFDGRQQDVDQVAGQMLADLRAKKDAGLGKAALAARAVIFRELTPYYYGKRIGGVVETLINELIGRQQEYAFTVQHAKDFSDQAIEKYHVNKWIHDKTHLNFVTAAGDRIDLTKEQAMTLYAWWVREITNKQQKGAHLTLGGFTYDTADKDANRLKKLGVRLDKAHVLNAQDMETIKGYLTEEQLDFMKDMVKYLSTEMAEKGNETSMALFGWKKYGEKWYFPYPTDRNFRGKNTTDAAGKPERQLKYMGASHALQEHAMTPLKLQNFTDLWAAHVDEMAMYHAFAEKLDNLSKITNYVFDGGVAMQPITGVFDVTPQTSMKKEMERAFGREAVHYIEQLIRDVNGGVNSDERGISGKLISLFKKGSVAANLSVVLQQPSAFVRAMSLVSPSHFAAVLNPLKVKENFAGVKKRMYENSGVAILKRMGRFDTNVGKSSAKWLMDGIQEETVKGRAMDYVDKGAGFMAEKADEITWTYMYAAIEHETEALTGLKRGTEEFNRAAAERFNAVMNATQVYDSTLAKSEQMRSTSTMDKMVTSFLSEPTLTVNMLMDAAMDLAEKKTGAGAHMARAAAVFTAAAFVNALLKSVATAFRRKKDEKRTWLEKYVIELGANFAEDVSPAGIVGMFPYARDVVSLVQGYDVERADMTVISELISKAQKVAKNPGDAQAWVDAVLAALNVTGVPARNVYRDLEGIFRNLLGGSAPISETDWNDIKYGLKDEVNFFITFDLWDSKNAAYYDRMVDALEKGDMQAFENLRSYVTGAKGVKEKDVTSSMKTEVKDRYKAGTMERGMAKEILGDTLGDTKAIDNWDKEEIKKSLEAGTMDAAEAEKQLQNRLGMDRNDAHWTVKEWQIGDESIYQAFCDAVETGTNLKSVVKEYTDYGKSDSTLSKKITEYFKPLYIQLYKTDKVAAANLKARILTGYEALGYDRDKKLKDMEKWLE